MVFRFIALIGDNAEKIGTSHEDRLRASGLSPLCPFPDCRLWVSSLREILKFENGRGVVLGTLFRGFAPAERIRGLTPADESKVEASHGRFLVDSYWGGYVALLAQGDGPDIVRDPSGALPCYSMPLDAAGTRVLFSDMDSLKLAGFTSGPIDWENLTDLLIAYDFRTERTALCDVTEVLAGTRTVFRGTTQKTETYWTPARFTNPGANSSPADLVQDLSQRITGVVEAWASTFEKPLLGVSGGLDSSIVATVLAGASRDFVMVTMATDEGDGDERRYARILGDHLGVEVAERHHRLDQIDVTASLSGHLPRPLLMAFGQSELKQKRELVDQVGADCFFSGVGGDNVFCNIHSASPLLDRVRREGIGRGAGRTLDDIGKLTGASHIEILMSALRRHFSRLRKDWFTSTLFLSAEASRMAKQSHQHPWLSSLGNIGPGKEAHVAMLARIQGTIDGYSRLSAPILVNPLLSQPLVEFCLSVPTWIWIAGGQNRSLARQAFADMLPHALIARTSKGTPNSFAFDVIDRNRKRIRDHLCEGRLAKQGLLDQLAIENALQPDRPLKGFDHMRLSLLAEAESWARLQS